MIVRRAVVVKLGSSTLVDARGRLRRARIERLCVELQALRDTGTPICVVSSGAIALGLGALGGRPRPADVPGLQAASAIGQGVLLAAWQRALGRVGGRAAQVLLTAGDVHGRTSYLNARATLETLLRWGVVPVVNENDSTATDEITFGDNDALAAQVALLLRARLLVLLTDADGVYTRDPRDPAAELVREVRDSRLLESLDTSAPSASGLGSGGMRSKVVAASMAAGGGVACVIASGARPESVALAVAGRSVGTRFHPAENPLSAWKLWLRYGKPTTGRLIIDDGACTALVEQGASLLPVGIRAVEGSFRAGDAVRIATTAGHELATGIVDLPAAELRAIAGSRGHGEVVHRDNLVLH